MIDSATVTVEILKAEACFIYEKINEFKENGRLNEKEANIKMKRFYKIEKIHLELINIYTIGYYTNSMKFIEKYL
jgi:predicted nucleic acid-binding protein